MTRQQVKEMARDITLADVGRLAGEIIAHRLEVARLENVCKRKQDAARQAYQDAVSAPKSAIKAKTILIETWAKRQPRSNGQPLSWKFPRAIVRLITGQPGVDLKYRVKLTDVVARLQALPWGGKYLRTPEPEFDRAALIRDRNEIDPQALEEIGVRISQDDELYIDAPKAEQQAAEEAA